MSFIPVTPAGTLLVGLAADSEAQARERLIRDARHMSYRSWAEFLQRGYTVVERADIAAQDPPQWYGSGY